MDDGRSNAPSNDFMASAIIDIQKLLDLLKLTTGGMHSRIFHVYSFPLFFVSKNFADFKDGFCYKASESVAESQGEKMGSAYMRSIFVLMEVWS